MAGTNSRLMGLRTKAWLIISRQRLWANTLGRRGGRTQELEKDVDERLRRIYLFFFFLLMRDT